MSKDIYKKSIDNIHAPEELKNKTFEKMTEKRVKKIPYEKYLAACAMIILVFAIGLTYINTDKEEQNIVEINKSYKISKNDDLPRFKNIEELKEVLKKNSDKQINKSEILLDSIATSEEAENKREELNYSTTNVQVENVDEADIVKTDGEYIYYVVNSKVYIVKADTLEIVSKIEIKNENERFSPREIYINKNKLILIGGGYEYDKYIVQNETDSFVEDVARVNTDYMTKAIVFDISDKGNPQQSRCVSLDGNYINSRMIGDNIYLISSKYPSYYNQIKDTELLPSFKDTAVDDETKHVECTDIVYFEDTESLSYMMVAGFNINNNEKVSIETFFGASSNIYASENNLYIAQMIYKNRFVYEKMENIIYKFELNDSKISLKAKGQVNGYLNNQFSMDEYNGNLRIATTSGYNDDSSNSIYILDENLKQIGKLEDLAKGEKIYSVRFMGKIGYVVTFKQVDPLFVIDLSVPTNPVVKGKLKIPGYSSYLHPYDETHIIGIGYNTKSNGYGGVTNSNMKMSMFDVSDLENPKEMFNISIGNSYAYSEILSNHKALFYNKQKNLIGFPVTYRENSATKDKNGFVIYKIDLNKGFEKFGEITQVIDYRTNIDRAIYIEDTLYTLSETKIISYNLNTITKIKELELE